MNAGKTIYSGLTEACKSRYLVPFYLALLPHFRKYEPEPRLDGYLALWGKDVVYIKSEHFSLDIVVLNKVHK